MSTKPRNRISQKWNPAGCTLLPIVRELIQTAYLETTGKDNEDYQPVWMPDLPIGSSSMVVSHDCRAMPKKALGGDQSPRTHSTGQMVVRGEVYMMCDEPKAMHLVYVAVCHNCQSVFFASAWDREDTLENFVKELKGAK